MEEHFVTTEDGYILGVHRIPHGRNEDSRKDQTVRTQPKQSIFLGHGLTSSSASYSWGPPDKSLGYILADAGNPIRIIKLFLEPRKILSMLVFIIQIHID